MKVRFFLPPNQTNPINKEIFMQITSLTSYAPTNGYMSFSNPFTPIITGLALSALFSYSEASAQDDADLVRCMDGCKGQKHPIWCSLGCMTIHWAKAAAEAMNNR